MKQLTKSVLLKKCRLLSHDEAFQILLKWYENKDLLTNLAVETNYPYVIKQRGKKSKESEICTDISQYCVLIIPPLSMLDRAGVSTIKKMLTHDKNAHLIECAHLLHEDAIDSKLTFAHLLELYKTIDVDDDIDTETVAVNHLIFKQIPNPKFYRGGLSQYIDNKIKANVHYLSEYRNLVMKGGVKFKTLLQGKNSSIRQNLPRRLPAFRGQILFRPELKPNEVIFPHSWQYDLNTYAEKLVDISDPTPIGDEYFVNMNGRIGMKRDPVININAYSFYNRVAFTQCDNIFIGPGEIGNKNADFDGDTQTAVYFNEPKEVLEIDLNVSPKYNLKSFSTMRVTFTESHALIMHQRQLPQCYKYTQIYNHVRAVETVNWLNNSANIISIHKIQSKYKHLDLLKYVEPTKNILEKALFVINAIYGSSEAYDFYNYININTIKLSQSIGTESLFYNAHLPNEYIMEDDILCEAIIRTCMSGAKGSVSTILTLAEPLSKNENTTKITGFSPELDRSNLFNELYETAKAMSQSSKNVSKNGHTYFKNNIAYDFISFDNNKLNYDGKVICNHLDFLAPCVLIDPLVAEIILHNKQ